MKVLGIVPARAGSKRVPGKNLRLLGGKPLVSRALETCLGAKTLDTVLLSTDSAEALGLARGYAGVVPLERPAPLASDTAPAIEYVRHALSQFPPGRFDAIAIIQPSS